ncbi:MAG: DUF4435 domain-containing protein [Gallionella sp.]|nr:DUF4435 domain-containing protein [Gallionella sp.]
MDRQRTVDEISTLYALEPGICDVYVEGSTDKHFFDWYLRRRGLTNVTVYPIDDVDIPNSLLTAYSLPSSSNRAKVIALSCELSRQQVTSRRVMCIVDRDSDDGINSHSTNPYLFTTDGNSMELYALTPAVIEKFLLVALAGFPITAGNLISKMVKILESIFAIRQTNERLGLGMSWIPFSSYIRIDSFDIAFKEQEFIRAYLQKNNQWHQQAAFAETKTNIQKNLNPELVKRVRGHDLAELLHVIVRKLRKERAFASSTHLEGYLMASIEERDLEAYPLFVSLERNAVAT